MFNNSSGSFNLQSSPSFLSLSFYLFSCPAFDLVFHLVSLLRSGLFCSVDHCQTPAEAQMSRSEQISTGACAADPTHVDGRNSHLCIAAYPPNDVCLSLGVQFI